MAALYGLAPVGIDTQRSDNRTLSHRAGKIPWLLLVILALASFLRIFGLGSEGLWFDEINTVLISEKGLVSIIQACNNIDTHPPLYYVILHFWMALFGRSDAVLQSLSAFFGIISVLLIYRLGYELFDRNTGLVASFLLAISYLAVVQSQEVRMYSLLLLLSILSFLFYVRILKADKRTRTYLICYSLSNILLCYTHIYGLLIIGSQVLYFVLFRRIYAKAASIFWGAQAATLVSFSPWIFVVVTSIGPRVASMCSEAPKPSLSTIVSSLSEFAGYDPLNPLLLLFFLFLCLVGVLYFPKARQRRGVEKPPQAKRQMILGISIRKPKTALLLVWFFSPLVVCLIISFTFRPLFAAKYLIGITPALYLLTARGINNIDSFVSSYIMRVNVALALVAVVALWSLPGLHRYYAWPTQEQWREAADFVEQNSEASDVVVVCPEGYRQCFDYYYDGDLERLGISSTVAQDGELKRFVDAATRGKERLWLVLLTFGEVRDAPIKPYLFTRYQGNLIVEEEFALVTAYLFDIPEPEGKELGGNYSDG